MTRELVWDECVNVRDLGGLPAAGGTTRHGAIVRSDTVRGLTSAGWEALVAHGVTTIVDLRSEDEVAADRQLDEGADWLVDPPAEERRSSTRPVATRHVPLLGAWDDELEQRFDRIAKAQPQPTASTRAVYLAILDLFAANVAAAVETIAAAPEGGVLIHCQAGKDRTGIVVALALMLVGVDVEAIADDYALSGPNIASLHDVWVREAPDVAERDRRRRIGLAPRGAMIDLVAEIDARWGGAEGYLTAAGVPDAALEALRRRLVA